VTLQELNKALDLIKAATGNSELPLQTIQSFIIIAQKQGQCTVQDLERALGMSNASASRNASYLSVGIPKRHQGYRLVSLKEGYPDRRYKTIELTAKGKELVSNIEGI
jgi:DNA-binding MarR family transcriptional regulator